MLINVSIIINILFLYKILNIIILNIIKYNNINLYILLLFIIIYC